MKIASFLSVSVTGEPLLYITDFSLRAAAGHLSIVLNPLGSHTCSKKSHDDSIL